MIRDEMPEPEELARIIDRACELFEEMTGSSPDRRQIAESAMSWARVLYPLVSRLQGPNA